MKKAKILIFIFSISLLIGLFACSDTKKQNGDSWEKDMNKLIDKATPKEGGK